MDDVDDPWVFYLVVRKEAGLGFGDLLAATASACVRCADRYEHDPRYAEQFAAWYAMAVRKVTLRANEREWHRLRDDFDVALAAPRGTVHSVAALPPRRRSQREKLLVQLQALTGPPDELPPSAPPAGGIALPLVINADAGMSTGKACAQGAHASLHAARSPLAQNPFLRPSFEAWQDAGRPVRVRLASQRGVRRAGRAAERDRDPRRRLHRARAGHRDRAGAAAGAAGAGAAGPARGRSSTLTDSLRRDRPYPGGVHARSRRLRRLPALLAPAVLIALAAHTALWGAWAPADGRARLLRLVRPAGHRRGRRRPARPGPARGGRGARPPGAPRRRRWCAGSSPRRASRCACAPSSSRLAALGWLVAQESIERSLQEGRVSLLALDARDLLLVLLATAVGALLVAAAERGSGRLARALLHVRDLPPAARRAAVRLGRPRPVALRPLSPLACSLGRRGPPLLVG